MGSKKATHLEAYTPLQAERYERKCLVEELTLSQLQVLVKRHPRLFYAPYPPRYVNSLYLDTADMENYYANVSGDSDRRKVRLRWYGEIFGELAKPVLEIKIKQGLVGMKQAYPFADLTLDPFFCDRPFQHAVANSELPDLLRWDLRNLQLVLLNRYYRHYYVSRDGCFRVTLDSNLTFYKVNGAFGNSFLHHQESPSQVILELKYMREQESFADRVISFFPFRVTRSSKYVQGVERVYF